MIISRTLFITLVTLVTHSFGAFHPYVRPAVAAGAAAIAAGGGSGSTGGTSEGVELHVRDARPLPDPVIAEIYRRCYPAGKHPEFKPCHVPMHQRIAAASYERAHFTHDGKYLVQGSHSYGQSTVGFGVIEEPLYSFNRYTDFFDAQTGLLVYRRSTREECSGTSYPDGFTTVLKPAGRSHMLVRNDWYSYVFLETNPASLATTTVRHHLSPATSGWVITSARLAPYTLFYTNEGECEYVSHDPTERAIIFKFTLPIHNPRTIALSPDGSLLAVANKAMDSITLYSITPASSSVEKLTTITHALSHPFKATELSFSADNKALLVTVYLATERAARYNVVSLLHNLETNRQFQLPRYARFDRTGNIVIAAHATGEFTEMNSGGEIIRTYSVGHALSSFDVTHDNELIILIEKQIFLMRRRDLSLTELPPYPSVNPHCRPIAVVHNPTLPVFCLFPPEECEEKDGSYNVLYNYSTLEFSPIQQQFIHIAQQQKQTTGCFDFTIFSEPEQAALHRALQSFSPFTQKSIVGHFSVYKTSDDKPDTRCIIM